MRPEWALVVGALAAVAAPLLAACSARQRPPREGATTVTAEAGFAVANDHSWCLREVGGEREVEESVGPRATYPNLRRVFVVVGHGDAARRVLACREVDQNLDGRKDVVRSYDEQGQPVKELADTDFDGRIDTWTSFVGGRVSQVLIDRNGDGTPDEKRIYVRGQKVRAERDENFDGKIDVWEIYEGGSLRRRGVDVDGDGKVDRWDRDEVAHREGERRELAEETGRGGAAEVANDAGATEAPRRAGGESR